MLDRAHRITGSHDFSTAVRRGRRAGTSLLVLHLLLGDDPVPGPARVGFVVGKGVGNAVTRNQVRRRLRHIARERLDALPEGALLVVRALPGAAGKPSSSLADDFAGALAKVLRFGGRR